MPQPSMHLCMPMPCSHFGTHHCCQPSHRVGIPGASVLNVHVSISCSAGVGNGMGQNSTPVCSHSLCACLLSLCQRPEPTLTYFLLPWSQSTTVSSLIISILVYPNSKPSVSLLIKKNVFFSANATSQSFLTIKTFCLSCLGNDFCYCPLNYSVLYCLTQRQ